MPKSKPPRTKQPKSQTRPPLKRLRPKGKTSINPVSYWTRGQKMFAGALSFFVAVLGSASAAMTFFPHVTVDPMGAFDPSSPSPTQFRITNANFVPLENVLPGFGVCELRYRYTVAITGKCPKEGSLESGVVLSYLAREELGPYKSFSLSLSDFMPLETPEPFEYADISVIVRYRVWFLPWYKRDEFRYFTKREIDGKLYWFTK